MTQKERFTPKLLALSIAAIIGGAQAAEQPATQQNNEDVEVIQVTGIRSSIVQSTELKKDAASVVDVITAEDVGKFPDSNVLDSLQRITGVQITRGEEGDTEGFQIRGMSQNRVEVNGRGVASGDESRSADLGSIPSELIESLEVIKSPTADLIEGSLGATVNLKTARPLSKKKDLNVFTVKGKYGDNIDEVYGHFNGVISRKWSTDSLGDFGVLFNFAQQENANAGDILSVGKQQQLSCGFYKLSNSGEIGNASSDCPYTQYRAANVTLTPRESRSERKSLTTTFQWRPTDNSELLLDVNYLKNEKRDNRTQLTMNFETGNGAVTQSNREARLIKLLDEYGSHNGEGALYDSFQNVQTSPELRQVWTSQGYLRDPDSSFMVNPITSFDATMAGFTGTDGYAIQNNTETLSLALEGKLELDSWALESELSYSKAEKYRDQMRVQLKPFAKNEDENGLVTTLNSDNDGIQTEAIFNEAGTLSLDFSDPRTIDLNWQGIDLANPAYYRMHKAQLNEEEQDTKETALRLDADYFADWGHLSSLEMGFRLTHSVKTLGHQGVYNCSPTLEGGDSMCLDGSRSVLDIMRDHPEFLGEIDGVLDDHADVNINRFIGLDGANYFDNIDEFRQFAINEFTSKTGQNYELTEKTAAVYIKANLEGELIGDIEYRANVGIRGVHTKVDGKPALQENLGDLSNDYTNWLPSGNIAFLLDDYVVRLSAAKVMVRPTFAELKPVNSIDFSKSTCQAVSETTTSGTPYANNSDLNDPNNIQALKDLQKPYIESNAYQVQDTYCPGLLKQQTTAGNIQLKPFTATNFDLSFEKYWGEGNSASVTFFYRDVAADVVRRLSTVANVYESVEQGGRAAPISEADGNLALVDGIEFTERKEFINGGASTREGVELAYTQFLDFLPGAMEHLGFSVNYTYSKGSRPDPVLILAGTDTQLNYSGSYQQQLKAAKDEHTLAGIDLLDQEAFESVTKLSKHSANASLFYDDSKFNARLAYNFRSKYYKELNDKNFMPTYVDDTERLDFSSGYKFNKSLSMNFNINNVLGAVQHEYTAHSELSRKFVYNDRTYTLGVTAKF